MLDRLPLSLSYTRFVILFFFLFEGSTFGFDNSTGVTGATSSMQYGRCSVIRVFFEKRGFVFLLSEVDEHGERSKG